MRKGKGRAGKQVGSQRKGKESALANKRARIYDTEIEVEDKGPDSDDSVGGGESVREKGDKPEKTEVCLFSYLKLTLLT
jgi:hypothetical protein